MFSIHDEAAIITLLEANGHKKFRYAQIENAIYKNLVTDFDMIETLPQSIRRTVVIVHSRCIVRRPIQKGRRPSFSS
jgi:adenine C2-methylase RlmN of 23S rRNA A2503 and tRNA A37